MIMSFITFFVKLKNLTNKSFAKSRMRLHCVLRVYLPMLQVMLEEYLCVEDPSGGLRRNPRPLSLDVIFKFCCLSFRTLVFGIVIIYF